MADGVRLNSGSGGVKVAADDVGGSMWQRIKLGYGRDSRAVDVSLENGLPVTLGDGPGNDAFGRLRVSNPETLFESQHQYDKNALYWAEKTVGASSSAHVADEAAVRMTVGANVNDSIIRQSRQYWRYQPGKSQQIFMTFGLGSIATELRARVGYFDGDNGVFLEQTGSTTNIVLRSKVSGSVVDTAVAKASWSGDVLDGSGPSGLSLDMSKSQILMIDLEWLSVGRVRVCFVIDGRAVVAHEFKNANTLTGAYMTTANLPVRYELTNVGGGSSDTIDAICCSVVSEGGQEPIGIPFSTSSGTTLKDTSSKIALVSIRPKALFNSIVNRGMIRDLGMSLIANTKEAMFEVIYNTTLGGTPSWASVDDDSIAEVDIAGTTITGGTILKTILIEKNASVPLTDNFLSRLPLALDVDGANPPTLTIAATTVAGGGAANAGAALNWAEVR